MNTDFFDYIDNEIKQAKTRKSISYLEKRAVRYVTELPSSVDKKTISKYKKRLSRTRKLAKIYKRRIK